jgi:hypothetical protein
MYTVGLACEINNFSFLNVEFHTIYSFCHTIDVLHQCQLEDLYSLQQTLCLDKFSDHRQIREIWNDNYSRKVVNKNAKQKRSKCGTGTPDNSENAKKTLLKYERRKIYLISSFGTT